MLPKENRLKKRKEVESVFKKGRTFRGRSLVLKKMENNLRKTRFCLIVPQNVSKKSTLRNRLKRQMGEIIRKTLSQIKEGFDVVLIALPEIFGKDFNRMKNEIHGLFKKANLIK